MGVTVAARPSSAMVGSPEPFRARTVALMLAVGVLAFVALLLLGAFAPDLRSGRNGGAHAFSNGATGYAGLVRLARETGRNPRILRDQHDFDTEDLLVVTPERGYVDISAALRGREAKPTLFVLPKWQTVADPVHRGWVRGKGLLPITDPVAVLSPGIRFSMRRIATRGEMLHVPPDGPSGLRFHAPRTLQVITGIEADRSGRGRPAAHPSRAPSLPPSLTPLLTDARGRIVLAQIGDRPLYVLADPDLLSNMGLMRGPGEAASALEMLDWLNSGQPDGIAFDVSFNGFGHARSPLKLLFEPPFLAMTVTLAAALLLAGWQAWIRFGPAQAEERAIAFGKAALVDNSAALVRKAGREAAMGGRYAALVGETVVRVLGAPAGLRDGALERWLDERARGRRHGPQGRAGMPDYSELRRRAELATDRESLLGAAQALRAWQKEMIG